LVGESGDTGRPTGKGNPPMVQQPEPPRPGPGPPTS
jgi:hypothetical protein